MPVWDVTHSRTPIPKLLTEDTVLRVVMAAAVGVVEANVEKERFFLLLRHLQELGGQFLYEGDVSTNDINWIVLLCVGEGEGIDVVWSHVFLPDDPSPEVVGLVQDPGEALDGIEGVEMVVGLEEAVHAVLVLGQAREDGGATRRAAAHGGVCVVEDDRSLPKLIEIGSLALIVAINGCLEAPVVCHHHEDVSIFFGARCWSRPAFSKGTTCGGEGLGLR